MSESCSGNCSNCGSDCASRQPESLLAPANAHSNVKKVIAVVSGKGGVGKSTVTSLLAVAMHKLGYKTAILDADITGPSIPQAFGLHSSAAGSDEGRLSAQSKSHARTPSRTGMRRSRPDREPPAAESSSVSSKGRTSRQGHMPRIHKTGCILLTGLVKTNQYSEKQAVQAESLHGLTEIILVFLSFVVKRKDEKHRKRRSTSKTAAGHDLSGEERKTDPFSRAECTGTRLRCSRSR